MLEKNSYITYQIQEERQVIFMCLIRESERKIFFKKEYQDPIKT